MILEAMSPEEFSRRVKEGIARAKKNPKPKKGKPTRIELLRKGIRGVRSLLGARAESFRRIETAVQGGVLSASLQSQLAKHMERIDGMSREQSTKAMRDMYRTLLGWERQIRRMGVRISPWVNRQLAERMLKETKR